MASRSLLRTRRRRSWESKWKVAEKKAVDLATSLKVKDDQIRAMKKEVEDAKSKLAVQATEMEGLKGLYEACQEELKVSEAVFVMRTRAQLMWQYLIGEASLWEA